MKRLLCTLSFFLSCYASIAQHLLGKVVSVNIDNQELHAALNTISRAGNFQFSYKSNIILQDKKVSLKAQDKTVKQLLDLIFEGNFHYSEKGKYVILHSGGEKQFVISGYIQNGKTGERLSNVTVYEDQVLASTLTNEHGYFKLPIKNKKKLKTVSIIARKEAYTEAYVDLNAGYDQELVLPILPSSEIILEGVVVKNEESSWASRIFLSSKQKIQNINIGSFMAKRPIQTSLLPGIGTHGLIGSQVVNKFSLNILGGYTAGVNGFEFGSLFNINKGNVRYVQLAGIFNSVNGNVTGFQMGGIYNYVSGYTDGYQVAGISNIIKGKVSGAQVAGVSNINLDTVRGILVAGISNTGEAEVKGVQIAGVVNKSKGVSKGVQLAGLTNWTDANTKGLHIAGFNNHSRRSMKGMQMAGFLNYARKMKGFQLSVINIADSMDGFGLGLVNYYKNGHHKVLAFTNELQNLNLGYLSGARNIYSLITAGMNIEGNNKRYSMSYGIGTEIRLAKKLALNPEISGHTFYIGHWDYVPLAARAQLCVTYKIFKPFEIFVAPAYTITETKTTAKADGYGQWLQQPGMQYDRLGNSITGWIGWQAGIRIF
ncbi:MAG: hypothetical protein JNL13_08590 [Chitinophagaceae bacterium]|nr:hypothetical protein [Chitinophagaceae bacterium]